MRPLFGPRTVVEAAFLVAVPVIALEVGLSWPAIIGAGAIAYLLVLAVEAALWRESKREAAPAPAPEPEVQPAVQAETVRVIRAEPVEVTAAPREPEPEQEAEPEPEPVAQVTPDTPRLVPVPAPEPPPAPARAPEPQPSPTATVVPISSVSGPRQWNLWDLERLSREHSGGDPIADEERTFLLLYLRDFAGPDGLLPVDFDDLVRQSFGGLVANL